MRSALRFPPLYPIIDVDRLPFDGALAIADAMLAAGASWLQLRCKRIPTRTWLDLAQGLVGRAAQHGARVIINDRPDIALAARAAGLHVGQSDLPASVARRLVGEDLVIGVSTHSVEQVRRADAEGADYLGFGPMFATGSKPDALSPRSLDELRAVRQATKLPIVAIGGVTESTAKRLIESGADAVAMIGALIASPDPAALARRLLALR